MLHYLKDGERPIVVVRLLSIPCFLVLRVSHYCVTDCNARKRCPLFPFAKVIIFPETQTFGADYFAIWPQKYAKYANYIGMVTDRIGDHNEPCKN